MLVASTQSIINETNRVRGVLIAVLRDKTPEPLKLFSVVKFSELDSSILSAEHYNTGYQLRRVLEYLESDRSLETILNCFQSIIDTGKAKAFDQLVFNSEARKIIQSLL